MSKQKKKPKKQAEAAPTDAAEGELGAEELDQVNGGIGLLLPAVQKVREAASTEDLPMEQISLNYEKITR